MKPSVSPLWLSPPKNLKSRIERCISEALDLNYNNRDIIVFFRADNIGVPGKTFSRLMEMFMRWRTPLSLAVVPAWLYESRWNSIKSIAGDNPSMWCWHQQGWRHTNYEENGKKQEFGPSRCISDIIDDIERGWVRMESLMGNDFYPVFTPPWNNCDIRTLKLLRKLKYYAISRYKDASPNPPAGLPDFQVNIDLHTRREKKAETGWHNLFKELKHSLGYGFCGIMIQHQRMNDAAFDFLEILLKTLAEYRKFRRVHLKNLVEMP